jgi:hypothetical protein
MFRKLAMKAEALKAACTITKLIECSARRVGSPHLDSGLTVW